MAQDVNWNETPPYLNVDAFVRVATTFINFCNALNERNYKTLEASLADDAVLYRIKNGTPIRGKESIMKYLKIKLDAEKPICAPITTALHPPSLPTSVRGVARWGNGPSAFSIQYEMLFQPYRPDKITSLWARPGC